MQHAARSTLPSRIQTVGSMRKSRSDISTQMKEESSSLAEIFQRRIRLTPGDVAYRQFDRARHAWAVYSWKDIGEHVARWRGALLREDLEPAARIGILLPNSVEHVCLDQAALSLGLVPVPLHFVDNAESLSFVLADSGVALLAVDSAAR